MVFKRYSIVHQELVNLLFRKTTNNLLKEEFKSQKTVGKLACLKRVIFCLCFEYSDSQPRIERMRITLASNLNIANYSGHVSNMLYSGYFQKTGNFNNFQNDSERKEYYNNNYNFLLLLLKRPTL